MRSNAREAATRSSSRKTGSGSATTPIIGRRWIRSKLAMGGPRAARKSPSPLFDKQVLILGAGGVARAIAFGLARRGAHVTITNRHDERATRLAEEVGCRSVTWSMRASTVADVIINATPVGMHPNVDDTPLPPAAFSRPGMVVFDTIYHPENTMMLKLARERGCKAVTGVDMFLRQAALQFKLYTGQDAPIDADARRPQTQAHAAPPDMTSTTCRRAGRRVRAWRWSATVGRANRPSGGSSPSARTGRSSTPISRSRHVPAGRSPRSSPSAGEPVFRDWEERTLAELIERVSRRRSSPPAAASCSAKRTAAGCATSASSSGSRPIPTSWRGGSRPTARARRPARFDDGAARSPRSPRFCVERTPLYEGLADTVIETGGQEPRAGRRRHPRVLDDRNMSLTSAHVPSPLRTGVARCFVTWPILAVLGFGFFLIGTVVGSFLNVCIYRIPWQKSVIWPSSRCPRCFAAIAALDNIPIVSWLALRGECRQCGAADLGALPAGGSPGRVACSWAPIWST